MPSPNLETIDWGDVVTTTIENRSRKLADNVTNNNALLTYIKKNDRAKPWTGGREIIQELRYAMNQSFMWYSGTEYLNVSLNDTMTAARYPIKQASVAVVFSGLDELMNDGEARMIDLIEARVGTAEDTFWNQMSAGVYSDGTGWGGKQITGLAALVAKVPSMGAAGGINRQQQPWWQNVSINANTDPRGPLTTSNIMSYMNGLAISLKRNTDGIDCIVADNNLYAMYLANLQIIQRVTDTGDSTQGMGFTALKYYGAGKSVNVILDGGKNGQIPPNTMYFLNTDYLHYRPSAKRNFTVLGRDRMNVNQDAVVRLWGWAGNLTASNLSLQGVLWM